MSLRDPKKGRSVPAGPEGELGYYLKTPVPLFKGPFSLELGIAQFPWGSVPELGYAQFPLVGGEVSLLPGVRSTPVSLGYYVPQCPYGALFKGPFGRSVPAGPYGTLISPITGEHSLFALSHTHCEIGQIAPSPPIFR